MSPSSIATPKPKRKSRLATYKEGDYTEMPETGFKIAGLDELVENPHNERKVFRDMAGLTETVRHSGVIEPLKVEPTAAGKYMIVIGHRRYRAARAAQLEEVPVIIVDAQKASARRRQSIVSNVQRENVGPVEMAEGLRALLDEDPDIKSQRQLALSIGKRESWVSDMLRVLTLKPDLQRKLRSTEVSVPYDSLMRIARLESQADQTRLIDDVLGGATQREIRDQIDQIKGRPKATPAEGKKPRRKYMTPGNTSVIVQSITTEELTANRRIAALKDALRQTKAQR